MQAFKRKYGIFIKDYKLLLLDTTSIIILVMFPLTRQFIFIVTVTNLH